MTTRRAAFALTVALAYGVLGTASAAAAEAKPAFKIDTRTIEATLTIEPKLKAFPGLYDGLLAEGKRELAKWRLESEKARNDMPDIFRAGRRYAFERTYTERSVIGRYVSVLRADYLDGLGAHPNRQNDTILWDAEARKRISIRQFLKESATGGPTLARLAHLIRVALAAEKKARGIDVADPDTDTDLARVEADLLKMGAVALAPSTETGKSAGLIFYFSPYAVGVYAEGDYTAFVPWTEIAGDLSPQGLKLFGGDRPADEDRND